MKSIPSTKLLLVAVAVIVAAVLVPVALAKHGTDDRSDHARNATKATVVHHGKKSGKRALKRHRVSREAEARHRADDPPGDDRGGDRGGRSGSDDPAGHR